MDLTKPYERRARPIRGDHMDTIDNRAKMRTPWPTPSSPWPRCTGAWSRRAPWPSAGTCSLWRPAPCRRSRQVGVRAGACVGRTPVSNWPRRAVCVGGGFKKVDRTKFSFQPYQGQLNPVPWPGPPRGPLDHWTTGSLGWWRWPKCSHVSTFRKCGVGVLRQGQGFS